MRLRVYLDFRTSNFLVVFTLAGALTRVAPGVGSFEGSDFTGFLLHEWRLFVALKFRKVVQLRVPELLLNWGLV